MRPWCFYEATVARVGIGEYEAVIRRWESVPWDYPGLCWGRESCVRRVSDTPGNAVRGCMAVYRSWRKDGSL